MIRMLYSIFQSMDKSNGNCNKRSSKILSAYEGRIEVILGPMFSGKTTELLRQMERLKFAKYRTCLVTYCHDNRYSPEPMVSTHTRQMHPAINCVMLKDIVDQLYEYDAIGIDEAHFIPDVVEQCEKLSNCGKIIIIAGLDGTYQRKQFGNFLNIIPLAEKVEKLNAVCIVCAKDAPFTTRTCESNEIELIGGSDKYIATCRKCFHEHAHQ